MIKNLISALVLGALAMVAQAQNPCGPGGVYAIRGQNPNPTCSYPDGSTGRGWEYSNRPQPPTPIYLPSKYGAIAIDMQTGHLASVTGMASEELAMQAALAKCGTAGCEIWAHYANYCAALVGGKGSPGFTGSSYGPTRQAAEEKGLSNCNKKSQGCWVVVSDCSLAQ